MLVAGGTTGVGGGSLRWTALFGSHLHMSIVERRGLVYDTRFVPASPEPAASRRPCIYLLLQGTWLLPDGRSFVAPQALVLSAEHLEGAEGQRSWAYRAHGEPYCKIEIHIDPDHTSVRPADEPMRLELDGEVWRAAVRVASMSSDHQPSLREAVADLVGALARASVVSSPLADTVRRPPSNRFQLLWKAIGPMIERLELRPTVKEIGAITGSTSREIDGLVRGFVSSFGLVGGSWRDASRRWRLRLAVLFLSAEDATIAEIARVVGYGSTDAMARAFRDAGLAAPSVIQRELDSTRRAPAPGIG